MKKEIFFIIAFFCSSTIVNAQMRWWGIYDFEIRKGAENSRIDLNSLPNDYTQLAVHQVQLGIVSEISSQISFSAMISNAYANSFDLKGLEFQLANVTYSHLLGDWISISAGKMLSPFGAFAKRQLATENPVIGRPLFYTYRQNISPLTGYLDSAGSTANNQYGSHLTTIYNGGYFSGVEMFGSFFDDLIEYDAAVMNAPLSSTTGDYNVDGNLAFHGRAAVHPGMWGTIGVSYAFGSFMQPAELNSYFETSSAQLNRFEQSTYGIDLQLSYLYYELNAEYISNRFNAPYIIYNSSYRYVNGLSNGLSLLLNSDEFLVDVKIEAPFYPGVFLAARYDRLTFGSIIDPQVQSSTYGRSIRWNRNANRYTIGAGYKPDRSVLIKLNYENTDIDQTPKPQLNVVACSVVVAF